MSSVHFRLRLLGSFRATRSEDDPLRFRTNKVRALLAYLALEAGTRPVSRPSLQALLWPAYLPTSAQASLRTALSNLRKILAPLDLIESDGQFIRFRSDHPNFQCDVLELGPSSPLPPDIEGEPVFMAGFVLDDCPEFMAWLEERRADFGSFLMARGNEEAGPAEEPSSIPSQVPLVGREAELGLLHGWLVDSPGRLAGIFGMGGQGKTALATAFVRSLNNRTFDRIIWCSLLNAPFWEDTLREWVDLLSDRQIPDIPGSIDGQISLLMGLASHQRCLFVLDNLETILRTGDPSGRFQPKHEAYGRFLARLAQIDHGHAALITSRERPAGFRRWQQSYPGVHRLSLGGLDAQAGRHLLQRELSSDGVHAAPRTEQKLAELTRRFSGNPLALLLAAHTVQELFAGDVEAFLSSGALVFGDITDVLAEQIARLSPLEQHLLFQLAIGREPLSWQALTRDLPYGATFASLLDGMRALQRRSLIQIQTIDDGNGGLGTSPSVVYGLQAVILEFVTEQLVERILVEILGEDGSQDMHLLRSHALLRADTPAYIREIQTRLILQPIVERLVLAMQPSGARDRLHSLLDDLRRGRGNQVASAATNLLHLLLVLGQDIRGADFSGLPVPGAYLRGVNLLQANFAGADLSDSAFTELIGVIRSIAVHPDGRRIAAGTRGGTIWIWHLPTRRVHALSHAHQNDITDLKFSPDGGLLASTGRDGMLRLWDTKTGRKRAETPSTGTRTDFSPDGRFVAVCRGDEIGLWDVGSGRFAHWLSHHASPVVSVAFAPSNETLVAADMQGNSYVWDWRTGRLITRWRGSSTPVIDLVVHPRAPWVAASSMDGGVQVWTLDGAPVSPHLQLGSRVWKLDFSPDGALLAGAAQDGHVYLWEAATGQLVKLLRGHHHAVHGVAFLPQGRELVSGSVDQTMRIWDVGSGRILHEVSGHRSSIAALALAPDGHTLAAGGNRMAVQLWGASALTPIREWPGHRRMITTLAFGPQGRLLASGAGDRRVRVWNAASGRRVRDFQGHDEGVESVAFHPLQSWLASGGLDGMICLWDVVSGRRLAKWEAHRAWVSHVAFSPDGTLLATCGGDQHLRLWSVESASPSILKGEIPVSGAVYGYGPLAAFHPDGDRLAFSSGTTIFLLPFSDLSARQSLVGHSTWVTGLQFSPDGESLVSMGMERTLRAWDASSGALRWWREMEREHDALVVSPDSRYVYTGSVDGRLTRWGLQGGDLSKQAATPGPYAGMNITGVTGITEAQRASLLALGAIETPPG